MSSLYFNCRFFRTFAWEKVPGEEMRDYIYNKYWTWFFAVQLVGTGLLYRHPDWVERYYSNGIYPYISAFLRRLTGWMPVSAGDLLYLVLVLLVLRWLRLLVRTRFSPAGEFFYQGMAFISVVYFVFHLLWGVNYYRIPLPERIGLSDKAYDTETLIVFARKHIVYINKWHDGLTGDSLPVEVPYRRRQIFKKAMKIYETLRYEDAGLSFRHRSVKRSLYSIPLSYMGFSGYLNPFTGEAQVNAKIPPVEMPFVTLHEMAHQYGYAAEDEANLLAYIACMESEDPYFRYSGELIAMQYILSEVYKRDKEAYRELKKELSPGILMDYQLIRDFWDSYSTPLEPVFKKMYDQYLKANRQKEGIDSYSAFVGYLLDLKMNGI